MLIKKMFWFYLAAMVLVVMGVRLSLIAEYGSPLPFWDQWNAQANLLFKPWLEGKLSWEAVFADHVGHRIPFTRLITVGLLSLNENQWSPLLEMSFNVLLATLNFMLITFILLRLLGWQHSHFIVISLGILWVLPFAHENTLAGFHSMWFLMVFFSLLAFWGVILHRPFSWQWWLGMSCALAAHFNLLGGLFTPATLVIIALYALILDSANKKTYLWNAGVALLLTIVCVISVIYAYQNPHLSGHDTPLDLFVPSLLKTLMFPWNWYQGSVWQSAGLVALLQMPLLILAFVPLLRRQAPSKAVSFTLALGAWSLLLAASMAYARPHPTNISSRYTELLVFNILANGLALYLLCHAWLNKTTVWRKALLSYVALWGFIVMTGFAVLSFGALNMMHDKHLLTLEQSKNTQAFIQTGQAHFLQNKPFMHIPFPDPDYLMRRLQDPQVQSFLPSFITLPKFLPTEHNDGTFVHNGFYPTAGTYFEENTLGSYGGSGNLAQGRYVSQPIQAQQSIIEIPVVGYWFAAEMQLQLVATNDSTVINVPDVCKKPPHQAAEIWMSCFITLPQVPFEFKLVAVDSRTDLWFAFASPRAIGAFAYLNQRVLDNSLFILGLGLSLLGTLALLQLFFAAKPISEELG